MIQRQTNWLGQWRVDVPHLRAMESSVAADFDVMAGRIIANDEAMVVSGFNISMNQALNAPATSLVLNTASGVLIHPLASESGSIFVVPSSRAPETLSPTNSRVQGSFTASQTNYVGVDLRRSADSTTTDVVQFLDTSTSLENPKSVPLARTLDYVITVSTSDFSATPGLCPIAKVTTDANNNVTAVVDARPMAYRLGSGGSVPNVHFAFPWSSGRSENTIGDIFSGGDKAIGSLKDWMNAAMTRLWEIGGGAYWYSPTADRNVTLTRVGSAMADGEWFTWDGTNLTWQGLRLVFDNAGVGVYYNDVANQTTAAGDSAGSGYGQLGTALQDGDCLYVDLDRTQNCGSGGTAAALVAAKGQLGNLGTPVVPGSRHVLAWRVSGQVFTKGSSFPVGATFNVATTSSLGLVKLLQTPGAPSSPVVLNQDANGGLTFSATGGNRTAIIVTGNGSGAGVSGTGGGSNGTGVAGFGGAGGFGIGVAGTANAAGGVGVQGSGGSATGTGVVAVGGNAGGSGLIVASSGVSSDAHIAKFEDASGNARNTVDHIGYLGMGRVTTITEDWLVNTGTLVGATNNGPLANYGRWSFYGTSATYNRATTTSILNANSQYHSVMSIFNQGGETVGMTSNVYTSMPAVCYTPDASVAIEFEMCIQPTLLTDANTVFVGLCDNSPTGAAKDTYATTSLASGDAVGIGFRGNTDTNYMYVTSNGTTATYASTGVGVQTSGLHFITVRIEIHGANSPYGAMARFFINGAAAFTTTTTLPRAVPASNIGNMFFVIAATTTATDNDITNVYVSPLRISYNRFMTANV